MLNKLDRTREVKVGNFTIGGKQRFTLIAGPCAIESEGDVDRCCKEK